MEDIKFRIPPKTWLIESVLVTLLCCMPLGIVGIIHASQVESLYDAGDTRGAYRKSDTAKQWTTYSFWTGILSGVAYLLLSLAGS